MAPAVVLSGKRTLVATEREDEWAPQPARTKQEKKSLVLTGIRTPQRPARSVVAIPTVLLLLLNTFSCRNTVQFRSEKSKKSALDI